MMRDFRRLAIAALCAVLAACGGGDSATVRVKAAPAKAAMPLLMASISEAQMFLPGLKAVKTRPSDHELKFTFPGDGKYDPATLAFTFNGVDGGKATEVTGTVDVPRVVAVIDGKTKVLSQAKIMAEVRKVLRGLEKGDRPEATTAQLSAILVALAISTDGQQRDKALAMMKNPSTLLRDLIEDEGGTTQLAVADRNDPTEYDTPRDDSEQFSPDRESERIEDAPEE